MNLLEEIKKLSQAEKILLVEQIWDDMAREREDDLTQEQKDELDRRLDLAEEGKIQYHSWADVKERIRLLKKDV